MTTVKKVRTTKRPAFEKHARRPMRADAQRNADSLLEAAKTVFARGGVDAPVREIAEYAGVGVGTVYRHFPKRADLIAAVFRREIDACADAGPQLAATNGPGEALSLWIDKYVDFIAAKRGLAAAIHSGDPAFSVLPAYFDKRLRPALAALLTTAIAAGAVRADVDPDDLLRAVASVSTSGRGSDPAQGRRMVALIVDGLRFGA